MFWGVKTLTAFAVLIPAFASAEPEGVTFEVTAGTHDRRETPMFHALPASLNGAKAFRLEDVESKKSLPVQVVPEAAGVRSVVFMLDELKAGTSRRYRLISVEPGRSNDAAASCVCSDDGKTLTLKVGGRNVLTYRREVVEPPPGIDPLYRRSGYIHPLLTPSGKEVTGDFAPDHAHQHALFFAWVNTNYAGRKVDFWNQQGRTGRVRALDIIDVQSGPVFAGFRVRQRHEDLTASDGPAPVLNEVWTVRAYKVSPDSGRFLIDFLSTQTCAGPTPLVLNKYIYGGLGIRGNTRWYDPSADGDNPPDPSKSGESDFLTSEGKHRTEGNHTKPRWVDLSGKLDGAFAGLTVLDDPRNFRFPQPVRLHPNKPYFCFAPVVEKGFTIEPGTPYVSRFRLVPHDGAPEPKAIDRLWSDLGEPPAVKAVVD